MSTHEILAQWVEDMLYLRPPKFDTAHGGSAMTGRHGQMKLSRGSTCDFILGVLIALQIAAVDERTIPVGTLRIAGAQLHPWRLRLGLTIFRSGLTIVPP